MSLRLVQGTAQSRLWNEYVARYHYLGYTPISGAQFRYNFLVGTQLVACISFGASAWKLKDRESFIGWSEEQRACNLSSLMDDAENDVLAFMTFPKSDWQKIYSTNPLERLSAEVKRRTNVVGSSRTLPLATGLTQTQYSRDLAGNSQF